MTPEQPRTGSGQPTRADGLGTATTVPEQHQPSTNAVSRSDWQWQLIVPLFDGPCHLLVTDKQRCRYAYKPILDEVVEPLDQRPDIFWGYIKLIVQQLTLELEHPTPNADRR